MQPARQMCCAGGGHVDFTGADGSSDVRKMGKRLLLLDLGIEQGS